jgi:hypothetical protein
MTKLLWIALAFVLGSLLVGCAKDRLTVSVYSVQYIENEPVELKVEYEVK